MTTTIPALIKSLRPMMQHWWDAKTASERQAALNAIAYPGPFASYRFNELPQSLPAALETEWLNETPMTDQEFRALGSNE